MGAAPGPQKGELTHHLWRSELAQKVKTGQAEPEVLWRHIANMYGLNVDNLRLLRASLHNAEYVNETLVDYIRSLRPHYKTAILSNAWRGSGEVFKHKFHLGQVFDRIMISADLGYAKLLRRVSMSTRRRSLALRRLKYSLLMTLSRISIALVCLVSRLSIFRIPNKRFKRLPRP